MRLCKEVLARAHIQPIMIDIKPNMNTKLWESQCCDTSGDTLSLNDRSSYMVKPKISWLNGIHASIEYRYHTSSVKLNIDASFQIVKNRS